MFAQTLISRPARVFEGDDEEVRWPDIFFLVNFSLITTKSRSEQTQGNGFHPRDESVTE